MGSGVLTDLDPGIEREFLEIQNFVLKSVCCSDFFESIPAGTDLALWKRYAVGRSSPAGILRLKYRDDDFTKKAVTFISELVFTENFRCKYRQNLKCPWSAIKILKAFNLVSPKKMTGDILNTKKMASDFLVRYNISKANYPRRKKRSKHWFTFGFPRGYQSDILELVSVLVDAGVDINSTNIKKALDLINSKRNPEGSWKLEYSLNGRMLVDIEQRNKPSKWITYMALKSLYNSNYLKLASR